MIVLIKMMNVQSDKSESSEQSSTKCDIVCTNRSFENSPSLILNDRH